MGIRWLGPVVLMLWVGGVQAQTPNEEPEPIGA